jgi:hypothetical protein
MHRRTTVESFADGFDGDERNRPMKATIALLTALLVSTICVSNARAQYPIQPVVFGGHAMTGGCADGSCGAVGGGCKGCGKPGLFGKKIHGCGKDGCKTCGKGLGNNGCGHKCWLIECLTRPMPSNAPRCNKPEYPLGFPSSPYVRSPRDYFMVDMPWDSWH